MASADCIALNAQYETAPKGLWSSVDQQNNTDYNQNEILGGHNETVPKLHVTPHIPLNNHLSYGATDIEDEIIRNHDDIIGKRNSRPICPNHYANQYEDSFTSFELDSEFSLLDDEESVTSENVTTPKQPISATEETDQEGKEHRVVPGQSFQIENATVHIGDVHNHYYNNSRGAGESVLEKLKIDLHREAEDIASGIDLPIHTDRAIHAVKLQVSNKPESPGSSFEEEGFYTRRKDSAAVYQPPVGDVALTQIFNQKPGNTGSRNIKRKPGNTIMVTGQAGIGKTVITKMIIQLLLDQTLLPDTQFIFNIKLREVDFTVKRSLVETLLLHSGCEWEDFREHEKMIYDVLRKSPDVLVVLDGLDEADTDDFTQETRRYDPMKEEKISGHLKNLIRGTFLPKARVLITSRPRESHRIHPSCRPDLVLRVLGLDKSAQEELGQQICGKMWPKVREYIEQNPQIRVICYVPVMCILAFHALSCCLSKGRSGRLNSVTSVLEFALSCYIRSDHVGSDVDLRKLSFLAWSGFLKRKIIFSEEDLRSAGIETRAIQSFICTKVGGYSGQLRLLNCDKKSCFSHLIWQEFFTAIHAMFVISMEEFREHIHRFKHQRWEVVTRCMFGVSSKLISPRISGLIGDHNVVDFAAKRDLLMNLAKNSMHATSTTTDASLKLCRIFQVCEWTREACDVTITTTVASQLPRKIELVGHILPNDVTNLMLVVRSIEYDVIIDIRFNTLFIGAAMHQLFEEISKCPRVKIRNLYLSRNKIKNLDAAVLSKCLKGDVKHLYLDRTGITALGLRYITDGILQGNNKQCFQVEELNLTEVKITTEMATLLAGCIENIETLFLLKCKLDETGIIALANGIAGRSQPMTEVNLRGNKVSDAAALSLAQCVGNIRRFYVHDCNLGVVGLHYLARAIRELEVPLQDWYVHHNNLGDAGAVLVATCMHNITDEIRMDETGVTKAGLQALTEARNKLTHKPEIHLGKIEGVGDVTLND
uniref:protein NLRC3-like isoform X3 n=1 Tax=Ciona intestinalis TaxID=7719 RepID=UPI000EF54AFC|nr:protein NLRC3-like isoform X3 [Ciona intestinalis]|eukprot:XP_026690161.1 protein NLRC3-like isoform X3 [Ciona intestinalis]